jgi:hypothetical protein
MALDSRIREILRDYDNGGSFRVQVQPTDFRQICARVAIQSLDDSDPMAAAQDSIRLLQKNGFSIVHGPQWDGAMKKTSLVICR